MIFLTVGSQVHFNRLTQMVEQWARNEPDVEIIAQIGDTEYAPQGMRHYKFMPPDEYRKYFKSAAVVVAHAGTGVTLTAAEFGIPLIMMPRIAELGEMRNNHQLEYLSYFASYPGIYPAYDQNELFQLLTNRDQLAGVRPFSGQCDTLVSAIKKHIWEPTHQ